jgi:hypothetical protein
MAPSEVTITFFDVGCVLKLEGFTIAYSRNDQMLVDLGAYVENPEATMRVLREQYPSLIGGPESIKSDTLSTL